MTATYPARFVNVDLARARFGADVDRLGRYLSQGDPLADALVARVAALPKGEGMRLFDRAAREGIATVGDAPEEFRAFFAAVEAVPAWFTARVARRGGEVLVRSGWAAGATLGVRSLVSGYASPGGNKPLIFSGRLQEAAAPRLNETAQFVRAVTAPGGLLRGAEGYRIALRVRVMHAQVRQLLRASGRFREDLWGVPINQHDMVATILLFSSVLLDGLRILHVRVSDEEAADYMQLWRYVGLLLGVEPSVQPATEPEAVHLSAIIAATQAPPDDDARALTAALLSLHGPGKIGERSQDVGRALCRALLGDALADQLAVPKSDASRWVPVIQRAIDGVELARRTLPGARKAAHRAGAAYWDAVIRLGLSGPLASFDPPERLGRLDVSTVDRRSAA